MTRTRPYIAIVSTAHGNGSGAESVLIELLRGWGDATLPLRLLSPRNSRVAQAAMDAGVPSIELDTRRDAALANAWALLAALPLLRGAGIVHAWHSRGFELALLAGRLLGIRATGSVHDHPECSAHGAGRQRMMRWAAKRLDALAFVSAAVGEAWRPVGVALRSATVHNGLADHRARREPRDQVRVGFLGMNTPSKGFGIAADWAKRSTADGVTWRFYGDPHPAVEREARARMAGAAHGIELAGRRDAKALFDEIDLLVHASTEFDSYPTVLLEAARAGIPVVASSLGGSAEIVEHGATGYLFDPRHPESGYARLAELLGSRGLREQMGRAARARFERHFTIPGMTDGYAAFWSTLSR